MPAREGLTQLHVLPGDAETDVQCGFADLGRAVIGQRPQDHRLSRFGEGVGDGGAEIGAAGEMPPVVYGTGFCKADHIPLRQARALADDDASHLDFIEGEVPDGRMRGPFGR